jgi:hypothetical protein
VISEGLPLLQLRQALREQFSSVRRGRLPSPPDRDRVDHAAELLAQIDSVEQQIAATRELITNPDSAALVTATGPNVDDPTVARSLTPRGSNAELMVSDEGKVVFRIGQDLSLLRRKTEEYASEDTRAGNPRNRGLVARINEVAVATIEDLSLGEISNDIDDTERVWVEIWTRGGVSLDEVARAAITQSVITFASLTPDGVDAIPVFHGPERDVHLVLATGASLKALPVLLPDSAEVHRAPTVFPIVLAEAQDIAGETADVLPPNDDAPVVALHDSGIDAEHPYVEPILLGAESVVPGEPATSDDADGHGTQMAGVAAYSDLANGIASGNIQADAWLTSVRLLDSEHEAGGDPDREPLWAARTEESVATAEEIAGELPVVHNLSLGADNLAASRVIDRTSWSVAVDQLAWNGGEGRLIVVAGGNAEPITDRADYPFLNLGPPFLQQPGQAWNALTVGGYTNLDQLTAADHAAGYPAPLAKAGELSPHSRAASVGNRPIKPDIVMEAGNTAPGGGLENPEAQGLSILTLQSSAHGSGSLIRRTYKTSPAAAAASNALARTAAAQPSLRPATWRALLVHTARWPEAAIQQMTDRRNLLRAFGYGVPDPSRAASSASNRPVMVYEGSLQPSRHAGSQPDRPADFIEIPLPEDELQDLGDAQVTLTVTLSYFIEPTDNLTRRAYAGGRLRWDLQGPSETEDSFRARINRLVRDQGVAHGGGSYNWEIPADDRSRGGLQHDFARVSAAEIAGSRLAAVYPVLGWWEDSREGWQKQLPYSIVISVDLDDVDVDLYAITAPALVPISL